MTYDPSRHHRRSIRLKGYDYSRPGAYFITIVAQDRACLFGKVVDGVMHLSEVGQIVAESWQWLAAQYDYVTLDAWVVMPNHIHGIIVITDQGGDDTVGGDDGGRGGDDGGGGGDDGGRGGDDGGRGGNDVGGGGNDGGRGGDDGGRGGDDGGRGGDDGGRGGDDGGRGGDDGGRGGDNGGGGGNDGGRGGDDVGGGGDDGGRGGDDVGGGGNDGGRGGDDGGRGGSRTAPTANAPTTSNAPTAPDAPTVNAPTANAPTTSNAPTAPDAPTVNAPTTPAKRKTVGRLVGAFKTVSTKRINDQRGTPGAQVWQRDFYEHIIRDAAALARIRRYIVENPARWASDPENRGC
jgi:REP element-mobilizing transposase RayT